MRLLQRNLKRTTDTFLFISHTTNVLLFKFRYNIFIGVRIIKEMPGSVASGTPYIKMFFTDIKYRNADKSLARPGRKQARKHVRDARDFSNIEARTAIKLFFVQGKAPKEIHVILTEILACFLPGRAKDLSASLYESEEVIYI